MLKTCSETTKGVTLLCSEYFLQQYVILCATSAGDFSQLAVTNSIEDLFSVNLQLIALII